MAARLDHITVVAPSLEAGSAYVEAALGVPPGTGRTHTGMATHNLLLSLGSAVYLEVISSDPGAAPVGGHDGSASTMYFRARLRVWPPGSQAQMTFQMLQFQSWARWRPCAARLTPGR